MATVSTLLTSGLLLLSIAALVGFIQHRYRHQPEKFALWRVAHNGGTAGGVQLLALAAVWRLFADEPWSPWVAGGVTIATLAFFIGPLVKALDHPRFAARVNLIGGLIALPAYVALPLLAL